jgi:hypothetical protein
MSRRPACQAGEMPDRHRRPRAVTGGGIPRGRPTLICGGAGTGKTLFGMAFLVRGIQQHDEPGVFMSFEELPTLIRPLLLPLRRMVGDFRTRTGCCCALGLKKQFRVTPPEPPDMRTQHTRSRGCHPADRRRPAYPAGNVRCGDRHAHPAATPTPRAFRKGK